MDPTFNGPPNSGFALAPGIERSTAGGAAMTFESTPNGTDAAPSSVGGGAPAPPPPAHGAVQQLDYKTDFPELPIGANEPQNPVGAWGKGKPMSKLRPSYVTQVFHLPAEERRNKSFDSGDRFGDNRSPEQTQCNDIAQMTQTTIELSESKDHSLTIIVKGKRDKVEEARRKIVEKLQTQASKTIEIPHDHHRAVIGRGGENLRRLEAETDCRIVVPNKHEHSDVIKVVGPKEGIDKALHQIQLISDEQSKLAQEHLAIPKIFYPWIRGPFNEQMESIMNECPDVKLNIPPPSANSDIIVVTGEKEGVYKAAALIKGIYEEKKKNVKELNINVARAQHRYVIGYQRSGLADVLKATGVSVEVPPEDAESDTITLRGDPAKLGDALTLVYAKASSVITAEIECPTWLHRFIIGQGGSNIKKIVGDHSKVSVNFEDSGIIFLEGPPEEVKRAQEAFSDVSAQLQRDMATETIKVKSDFHRHIIGKSGGTISKIKNETGVLIHIPDENSVSDEIRIEGNKEGVLRAKQEILTVAKRLENEKSRDLLVENRIHKLMIGSKGETIREIREKYPGMSISFPEPGKKSDIISLRGPKEEVDKCHKDLMDLGKKLLLDNFQVVVPIFKDFHKNVIGKGGATIRKIRDETQTRVDLPAEASTEDGITITGRKENVEKAVAYLNKLQNDLASIVILETNIPQKLHSRLGGNNGRLVQDISEQCGGSVIRFPTEKQISDKVTVRGPKDDAERALKLLLDLAKDRELSSFQDSVKAKPELFRFLIGRGGAKIKKVREAHANVRILFPRNGDPEQDVIHLIGKKEDVASVKKQLEDLIAELNTIAEIRFDVDPKWHRHFVARGAHVLREIQTEFGNVMISFPKPNSHSNSVSIKGGKDLVEGAKKRIEEIVHELDSAVTIDVPVLKEHHSRLLQNRGAKIQEITATHNVQIKFPDRDPNQSPRHVRDQQGGQHPPPVVNGEANPQINRDVVQITGLPENVEAAKEDLLAYVPVTETIDIPFEAHRSLIGPKGQTIRNIQQQWDVSVGIPNMQLQSNEINVTGTKENVRGAIEEIRKKTEEYHETVRDKELKSFEVVARINPEYHSRIMGPRGKEITRIREQFDVQIDMPGGKGWRGPPRRSQEPDEIIITGYENMANQCKLALEKMVSDWEGQFSLDITLDSRIHNRLIGQKGKTIKKIMEQYDVEIKLPRTSDPDPNLVRVSGKTEDSVYDCVDYLRNMEEEFLQDVHERMEYSHPSFQERAPVSQPSLEIVNSPWTVPDTNNAEEFPDIGGAANGTANGPAPLAPAWGRKR